MYIRSQMRDGVVGFGRKQVTITIISKLWFRVIAKKVANLVSLIHRLRLKWAKL